jgi:aminomethyltransferase
MQRLTKAPIADLKYYRFTFGQVNGVHCLIARTGYTGEDGFEIYFEPQHSEKLWNVLLEAGKSDGLIPCGLGARNTLRLEAGMCLYGHEIDETTTPREAGLAWICKPEKGHFLGHEHLVKQREKGLTRTLVGFEMTARQIARDGCDITVTGENVGRVTSGSPAPFLKKNIGMAYVQPVLSEVGAEIEIGIRGNRAAAKIVPLPFYKRPK